MTRPIHRLVLCLCGTLAACGSSGGAGGDDAGATGGSDAAVAEHFSFFVTSLKAMQQLSGIQSGFGGDLRFGETGPGAGLRGADKICSTIAEMSMPGAGTKSWRAFLSATADENGKQVNALERIGEGPWYDRLGRVLALQKADLQAVRPTSADSSIQNDFPNEDGVPNHAPDPSQGQVDNHDILTGSDSNGNLYGAKSTCLDWTANSGDTATEGVPHVGHSWPRSGTSIGGDDGGIGLPPGFDGGIGLPDGFLPSDGGFPDFDGGFPDFDGGFSGGPDGGLPGGLTSGDDWKSALDEAGCAPGVNLIETGGPDPSSPTVGSGGGYGGIYCFALTP
jgi:hypothetical protein